MTINKTIKYIDFYTINIRFLSTDFLSIHLSVIFIYVQSTYANL